MMAMAVFDDLEMLQTNTSMYYDTHKNMGYKSVFVFPENACLEVYGFIVILESPWKTYIANQERQISQQAIMMF